MNQVETDFLALVKDLHTTIKKIEKHVETNALAVGHGFLFAVKAVKTFAADKLVAAGIDIDTQAVDAAIPASIAGAVGAITPYLSTEGLDFLSEADSMWKGGANPFKVEKVAGGFVPPVDAPVVILGSKVPDPPAQ